MVLSIKSKEKEISNLNEKIRQLKKYWKDVFAEKANTQTELEKRLKLLQSENKKLCKQLDEIEFKEENDNSLNLPIKTDLENQVEKLKKQEQKIQEEKLHLKDRLEKAMLKIEKLKKENQEKENDIQLLLEELDSMLHNNQLQYCPDRGTERCPGPLLCGRRILYVGGRQGLVEHYRRLVENHGAEFMHHDGGQENSRSDLPRMLDKADVVFCPVDCINHNACKLLKNKCKKNQKKFYILRSSGVSSLENEISLRKQEML